MSGKTLCFLSVRPPRSFVRSSFVRTNLVMNGLSSLNETYRKYSLAPTDDLIKFWRSKVKVTAGPRGSEGIHVDSGASNCIFYSFDVAT